jgi:chromate transporter
MSNLLSLFLISMLISLTTFGGGAQALFYQYGVLQTGWISRADLTTILGFGYATPGPAVFGAATFIGYRLGGVGGAIIGTIGIFIIPFLLAFLAAKYLTKLLSHRHALYAITAIGLAATGLVAMTGIGLLSGTNYAPWELLVSLSICLLSLHWNPNPLWLLVGGTSIDLLLRQIIHII